jgi:hypothetical protein
MSYSIDQAFANRTRDPVAYNREIAMYGCAIADFKESIEDSFTFKLSGPTMVAMSLMSDAQEEMAHGMTENARQTINRAKWILSEYVMNTLKL